MKRAKKYYHAVYRKPRTPGEPYCPFDIIPQRKTFAPAVQYYTFDGDLCQPGEHFYISMPPGFPPPLGYVFVGTFPMDISESSFEGGTN